MSGRFLRMRDPLPLPLDSKYHMFCFLIINKSSLQNQRPLSSANESHVAID